VATVQLCDECSQPLEGTEVRLTKTVFGWNGRVSVEGDIYLDVHVEPCLKKVAERGNAEIWRGAAKNSEPF
jgi:hypothetical protein